MTNGMEMKTVNEELQLLDEALKVMSDFHATFQPTNDAELTPQSTPSAFRAFCDALASLHYRRHHLHEEPELIRCTACIGGRWEAECCNGSSGCSCGGQPVDMGACRVCGGTGWRSPDANVRANADAIRGLCYLGSGPRR